MNPLVEDVVAFCRMFAMYERDAICCGTVTVPQCIILQTLQDGEWDVSALAAKGGVTNGAMTRLLDGLDKRGFIRRVQDEKDRRRFMVELTEEGRAEAKRLAEMTETAVNVILGQIPEAKRKSVVEAIALMRKAAEETRDEICC